MNTPSVSYCNALRRAHRYLEHSCDAGELTTETRRNFTAREPLKRHWRANEVKSTLGLCGDGKTFVPIRSSS